MNTKEWNKTAMINHVWNLIRNDKDSIWKRWIRSNLIKKKNRSLWEILISNARSWAWRNILKLKG